MPRGKRAEQLPRPIETPAAERSTAPTMLEWAQLQTGKSDEELTRNYFLLDDWLEAESKRFAEHVKPTKLMLEAIKDEFLRRLNERKADSTKTDVGTAYKSQILNVAISPEGTPYHIPNSTEVKIGRDALLDFALDNWEEIGNELLIISAQKDAVRRWMDEHNGQPPPGLKLSTFVRINIRRS